jgi:hypothetical protein
MVDVKFLHSDYLDIEVSAGGIVRSFEVENLEVEWKGEMGARTETMWGMGMGPIEVAAARRRETLLSGAGGDGGASPHTSTRSRFSLRALIPTRAGRRTVRTERRRGLGSAGGSVMEG